MQIIKYVGKSDPKLLWMRVCNDVTSTENRIFFISLFNIECDLLGETSQGQLSEREKPKEAAIIAQDLPMSLSSSILKMKFIFSKIRKHYSARQLVCLFARLFSLFSG